jgi:hypothetical protein
LEYTGKAHDPEHWSFHEHDLAFNKKDKAHNEGHLSRAIFLRKIYEGQSSCKVH